MGSLFLMFGLLAAGSWLVVAPAAAQPVEQFYKGKTMTIMLGHPPGGSYDLEGARSCVHPSRRMGAATDLGFTRDRHVFVRKSAIADLRCFETLTSP